MSKDIELEHQTDINPGVTMKRAKLNGIKSVILEESPEPTAAPGEVVVAVKACGICGSDIHAYFGEHPLMKPPLVLGHEFSGVIDSIGNGVDGMHTGDRVTVEPLLVCGQCEKCLSGRYNVCEDLRVMGCHADGAFAEKFAVPADKIIPLPDDVSFAEGALVEPAAVAHHAACRAQLQGGEKILIFGAGPIGLFTLQMLKVYGAGEVACVDVSDYRLQLAQKLGADDTMNPSQDDMRRLKELRCEGKEFDLIVDCVGGSGKALDQALDIAAKGSRILAVGILEANVQMQYLTWIAEHELELIGSFTYVREDFEKTVLLMQKGRVSTEGIASHCFTLDKAVDAFKLVESPDENFIKAIITLD